MLAGQMPGHVVLTVVGLKVVHVERMAVLQI